MKSIIAGFATTIDGFIEGPNGEIDWITYDKEQFKDLEKQWQRIDTMFYGRKTYETVSKASTGMDQVRQNPFANMKHYVFSKSLTEVSEEFILIKGDLKTEIDKIRNEHGKDIAVFGGAKLLNSLLNLDLVDELVLAICPVLLGKGKPFFPSIEKRIDWKVNEVKTYASGLISISYQRKK
jgi:dihydrofolate reductase